jgi:hypothetical protein
LHDVLVGTTCATNTEANVVIPEVIFGKLPELLIEGSREHHVAMVIILVEILQKSVKKFLRVLMRGK